MLFAKELEEFVSQLEWIKNMIIVVFLSVGVSRRYTVCTDIHTDDVFSIWARGRWRPAVEKQQSNGSKRSPINFLPEINKSKEKHSNR